MAKLPKQVKVGAVDVPILLEEHLQSPDGRGLWGRYEFDKHRILLEKIDTNKSHFRGTVLHELLHAMFDLGGVSIPKEQEEPLVTHLTIIMMQVMRDNPKLMEFLLER